MFREGRIQRVDIYKTTENTDLWRNQFNKPVIVDEMAYEGNIEYGWGNISGQEIVRRFWQACMRGGYGGHGETFISDDDILWWSHGGRLHGESQKRLKFLNGIISEVPGVGLKSYPGAFDDTIAVPEERAYFGEYYLYYYDKFRTCCREFNFAQGEYYKVEIIDTWNMVITNAGIYSGHFKISMPGKEFMAIRITRIK